MALDEHLGWPLTMTASYASYMLGPFEEMGMLALSCRAHLGSLATARQTRLTEGVHRPTRKWTIDPDTSLRPIDCAF